ncbi:MAG TPA: hypothetical protein VFG15_02960 [Amycolatopsis sp.]|nr:hypothetical protein [Amycolatopsis sp.]
MPEHTDRDIITAIDDLTNDAATWSAAPDDHMPSWAKADGGRMIAVELGITGPAFPQLSASDPAPDIAKLIGDPGVRSYRHLSGMQFWIGRNSVSALPVNEGATKLLRYLLAAVRDGHYIASDADRDNARALLGAAGGGPVIHGPCLVTGVADDGGAAPLDENFRDWFTEVLETVAEQHALFIAEAIARQLGAEAVDVTFVRLG